MKRSQYDGEVLDMSSVLEGAVTRERRFRRAREYVGRYSRWADPDIMLMYFCNGHVVSYGVARADGKVYDVTLLDGHVIGTDEWYARDNETVRASEAFAIATGMYPHEFEAICDELDRRAREAIDAGDHTARGVTFDVIKDR